MTVGTDGTDFGNLLRTNGSGPAGCSSAAGRGVFGGGYHPSGGVRIQELQYIAIATTGNSTDFGDLTTGKSNISSCSNGTRGVWGGGFSCPTVYNAIDYVAIATTGDAADFGDMTTARDTLGACSGD